MLLIGLIEGKIADMSLTKKKTTQFFNLINTKKEKIFK